MSKVQMQKVSIISSSKDEAVVLDALQDTGVLHVTPFEIESTYEEQKKYKAQVLDEIEKIDKAISILSSVPALSYNPSKQLSMCAAAEKVLQLSKELNEKRSEHLLLSREIKALKPWQNLGVADLSIFKQAGVEPLCSILTLNDWALLSKEDLTYVIVHQDSAHLWVVFFLTDGKVLPVSPFEFPSSSIACLQESLESLEADTTDTQKEIAILASLLPQMRRYRALLNDREAKAQAQVNALYDGPLFGLQGYIPVKQKVKLDEALSQYAVHIEYSENGEGAPILLKNNWFVSGFEEIVKSFSGVAYAEKDFTWTVALLFIVFGSLCLLDAGYGILLFITGAMLFAKNIRPLGKVFMISGVFAVALGLLCGAVFGFSIEQDIYSGFKAPLNLATDPLACFYFSLMMGLVVMGFSYLVAIWQRGIQTQATGSLFFVLCGAAFVLASQYETYKLNLELTSEAFLLAAIFSWVVFPEKIFGNSRIPNVIWTLYSGVTGLVQDILSHMRLFGIALSGAILALVVNKMASMMPLLPAILFAIVAHIVVYLLALLSLYIHANRLIFLEFGSKCIDGGHCYYSPLRRGISS